MVAIETNCGQKSKEEQKSIGDRKSRLSKENEEKKRQQGTPRVRKIKTRLMEGFQMVQNNIGVFFYL